jgi:hypothetical protein
VKILRILFFFYSLAFLKHIGHYSSLSSPFCVTRLGQGPILWYSRSDFCLSVFSTCSPLSPAPGPFFLLPPNSHNHYSTLNIHDWIFFSPQRSVGSFFYRSAFMVWGLACVGGEDDLLLRHKWCQTSHCGAGEGAVASVCSKQGVESPVPHPGHSDEIRWPSSTPMHPVMQLEPQGSLFPGKLCRMHLGARPKNSTSHLQWLSCHGFVLNLTKCDRCWPGLQRGQPWLGRWHPSRGYEGGSQARIEGTMTRRPQLWRPSVLWDHLWSLASLSA